MKFNANLRMLYLRKIKHLLVPTDNNKKLFYIITMYLIDMRVATIFLMLKTNSKCA